MNDIKDIFIRNFDGRLVFLDEPMSKHTSFKIGGEAAVFLTPDGTAGIIKALEIARHFGIKHYVLGKGSNVLFSDEGFDGVIINISNKLADMQADGHILEAQAGVSLSALANFALENGLAGLEFASGIPGTLGGGVFMNAGAYGGEMKDVIISVDVLNKDLEIKTYSAGEMSFSYRYSRAQQEDFIILSAKLRLDFGNKEQIRERMLDLNSQRKQKQPLDMPSAGSTFKRPQGHFAGKLIMDSGLSGFSIGGAQISEKHCGFIVNKGGATCKNVLELINYTIDRVYENFGVLLAPEVRIIQ